MVNHLNPSYQTSPQTWNARNNLVAMLSDDDGKTWKGALVLDTRNEISYPDGVQADNGDIYVIYDYERYGAREILMAVFTEEDAPRRPLGQPARPSAPAGESGDGGEGAVIARLKRIGFHAHAAIATILSQTASWRNLYSSQCVCIIATNMDSHENFLTGEDARRKGDARPADKPSKRQPRRDGSAARTHAAAPAA